MSVPSATILCIHDRVDPTPFLRRLLSSPKLQLINPQSELIPWHISNKYYTADVHFRLLELVKDELKSQEEPVVLYLFSGKPPNPLPPSLVKLLGASPPDISLAIRVKPSSPAESSVKGDEEKAETERADVEEIFMEIGMEYVDEIRSPEDDDERPIDVLEEIRQTLQTHLWPNMVRVDAARSSGLSYDSGEDRETPEEEDENELQLNSISFPVKFATTTTTIIQSESDGVKGIDGDAKRKIGSAEFPDIDELRAQVLEFENEVGGITSLSRGADRLEMISQRMESLWADDDDEDEDDMVDDDGRPGEEEYARLDDWLEEGSDPVDQEFHQSPEKIPTHLDDAPKSPDEGMITPGYEFIDPIDVHPEPESFEDDFADFQSPLPTSAGRLDLPLDPTPLLVHLQAVRAELAGVPDEDARRVRAGREVLEVMRGLGLGGTEDFGFGDEDDFDLDML